MGSHAKQAELKLLRERKGLTQDRVTDLSGVSKYTISRWESGAIKRPQDKQVWRVAEVYGVDPDYLSQLITEVYMEVHGNGRPAADSPKPAKQLTTQRMARAVKRIARRGIFQFVDFRNELKVESSGPRHSVAHNFFTWLHTGEIIDEAPPPRRRNRFFYLADEARLEEIILSGRIKANGRDCAPDLAVRVTQVEETISQVNEKVDRLLAMWS